MVKSFAQAADFTYIDPQVMNRSISYLLKQQVKSTGEFTELGIIRHKAMQVCILIYIFILYEKHITFNIFCFQNNAIICTHLYMYYTMFMLRHYRNHLSFTS